MRRDLSRESAEALAFEALAFLAGDDDRIGRFLAEAGLAAEELRERAGDIDFLRAVLEFLLTDDRQVSEFCAEAGIEPKVLHLAAHKLGG